MNKNRIPLIFAILSLAALLAIGFAWGGTENATTDTAVDARPDPRLTRVVNGAVSMEDDLTCSWTVVISEPLLDPRTREWRVLVVATLDYQLGVQHFGQSTLFRTVDPRSEEELTSTLSLHPSSVDPGLADRLIHVTVGPFRGTSWHQVESDEQVFVQPTLLELLPSPR